MDIGQAVRRLQSGERVRRTEWEEDKFLDPDKIGRIEDDPEKVVTYDDLLADDWETYDG